MEINLEGIDDKYKEMVEVFINDMVKSIFGDKSTINISKIILSKDIISTIEELFLKKDNSRYIKSEYGDLYGKCICENGITNIYLNNVVYNNFIYNDNLINYLVTENLVQEPNLNILKRCGYLQLSTIYHELMHVKNYNNYYPVYKDFKEHKYSIDVDIFQQAFSLWDEYLAVKRTTLVYFDIDDLSKINQFFNLVNIEYTSKLKKIRLLANEEKWDEILNTSVLYVDEIRRYLSYSLGILDGLEANNIENQNFDNYKENFIAAIKESSMGNIFLEIWLILKNVDLVIREDDIIKIGEWIKRIYSEHMKVYWLREDSNSYPYYLGLLE